MRKMFYLLILIIVGGLAWIRLAPSKPEVWHVDPQVTADQDLTGGVRRRVAAESGDFQRLHGIILSTPRTELVAGGVEDGMATYVTRSQLMGFPDYTTVKQGDGVLEIHARLRFGVSDTGVNQKRVDGWLEELRAGGA
ncbi:DUF1499 domain-containing protein [Sagittula sp. SSi028]|uniref:DUF1499 domain-containing protein n=1 Tax=Sagittula sp. SSi028 TaxID=3400636 RepID=UPI003AF9BC5B